MRTNSAAKPAGPSNAWPFLQASPCGHGVFEFILCKAGKELPLGDDKENRLDAKVQAQMSEVLRRDPRNCEVFNNKKVSLVITKSVCEKGRTIQPWKIGGKISGEG